MLEKGILFIFQIIMYLRILSQKYIISQRKSVQTNQDNGNKAEVNQ